MHQCQTCPGSFFSAALKKTWSILFLPLTPTASWPIDAGWYSSTFISAAYEPDMIYAVPLTSLSPSSVLPALTRSSSLPPRSSSPLCSPSLPTLQSSLSNGDKGRPTDYLSNGKKRKADEKEFMTDYVRLFHHSVKCLSNWRKVSPNSTSQLNQWRLSCGMWRPALFLLVIKIITLPPAITVLLWKSRYIKNCEGLFFLLLDKLIVASSALSLCSRRPAILKTAAPPRIHLSKLNI